MMRRVFSASVLCTLLILALLTTGLTSLAFANNAGSASGPRARITKAIDDSQLVTMHRNTHPLANAKTDRGPVSDTFNAEHMFLVLQRSASQERRLNQYIDSLNDRNSPNFHQWLTAEEIGAKYGVAQEDIDQITGWLQYHGFRVNQVFANRMMIDFSGTAGQLREAFHTSIHNLEVNGEQHVANINDPAIPAALAPVVRGITSLNDFRPHPSYMAKPDYTFGPACASSATIQTEPGTCYAVTPQDDAVIYNLNPLWSAGYTGAGQTIAVVEDTDTFDTTGAGTEWTTYRSTFGLSSYPGTYTEAHPGGCTDPGANADDGEAAIDVEMATTFAPGAAVELISCGSGTFSFGGIIALANLVNGSGPYPQIVSQSYGTCETETGDGGTATFSNVFQTAAAEGTSVFVSTGDSGPTGCAEDFTNGSEYNEAQLAVSGWGTTNYNVAVGGTDFEDVYNAKLGVPSTTPISTYWNSTNSSTYGSAKSYVPEIPWNDSCASALISDYILGTWNPYAASPGLCNNATYDASTAYLTTGAASGGASNCGTGVGGTNESTYLIAGGDCQGVAKPSWQSAYGVPTDGVRDIPDVSLFAANGIWGHFQTVCWNDTSQTSAGAAACTGAPSTWSGFGGTSVATPSMAGIQALINQVTGETWGNPNSVYYTIAKSEYGTQGGTFLGSSCNSSGSGGPAATCPFNDVTQGDIDVPCRYDSTTIESDCYKPSTNGVASTDNVTATNILWGGSGYTTAPTCTIAGPTNNAPYTEPNGTVLYAGGVQATCTAAVNTGTTTAVWTVNPSRTYASYVAGLAVVIGGTQYTLSGTSTTAIATNLCTSVGSSNPKATCTAASGVATLTAKTAGAAGNFSVDYGPQSGGPDENETLVLSITNTVKGQGPNYVSAITINNAGRGYAPNTPITFGGPGTGAVAVANTSQATASQSYQPTYGAGPGYDLATGLGSPNATALVCSSAWGTPPSFCVVPQTITCSTAAPSSAAYNSTFTLVCTASSGLAVAYTSSGVCSNSGAAYTMTSGTGTCTVDVNQSGGSNNGTNYSAAPQVQYTVNATLATASCSFSNLSQTYTGSPLSPTVTTTPGGLTYTSTGYPDTNAGTYPVTCTISSGQNYSGSGSGSFVIGQASNTVTFTTPAPASAEYGSSFTVAASGLGTGAITYTSGGSCSNSGATYTMTSGSGTCTVTATQAADTNYPSANASESVTAEAANATVGVALTSGTNPANYGTSLTFTATVTTDTGAVKGRKTTKRPRDENGTVSWSSNTGCSSSTVSGASPETATCTTTALLGGTDTVTATYTANDGNHNSPASGSVNETINAAANTVTFTTPAPSSAEYGSSFTVAASGLGTGAITYTSDGVVCTNSGATYTMIEGSGTCTVTATQAGDTNYGSASASESVTAEPAVGSVSVALTSGSNPSVYGSSITFTATVTSDTGAVKGRKTTKRPRDLNGSVAWSSNTGCSASSVSGNSPETATCTTSILGGGTDTVTATYTASDSNHTTGSGSVSQTVSPASQTITVTTPAPSTEADGGTFTVAATASSGLTVTFGHSGVCSGSNGTYTMTSGSGICKVFFHQAGNANYSAAPVIEESVTAEPLANTVTFTTPAPASAEYGSSFTVAASGLGTGAITYTSDGVVCTNSGATYTMIQGSGTCTVTATQAADSNYQSASASESVTAEPAVGSVSVALTSGSNPSVYGSSITFTATVTSDTGAVKGRRTTKRPRDLNGSVAWSSNTGCSASSVSGNSPETATCTTSILGGGTDTVTATYTASDANHTTGSGSISQTVNPAPNTVTFTTPAPASAEYGSSFTVAASGLGTGAITYTSDGVVCTNSGATYTMISGSGTCTVTATQAADANYQTANASESVTAQPAVGSVSVSLTSGSNPSTYGSSITFTATVTSDTGAVKGRRTTKRPRDLNGSVSWSSNTGCSASSVSGNSPETATCTTSILAGGTDTVTATYTASDSNHTTASGSISQTVNPAGQTITVSQPAPASAAYNSSFNVAATASSSLAVSIATTGSCSGSGSGSASITMTSGSGSCLVTFSQGGNANYSAAANVNESTNATPASQSITVTTPAPATAIDNSSFTVMASASSGLAITFGAGPSTVCSVTSSTATSATVTMALHAAHNATCTTTAAQPGNSNYSAAATVSERTTVATAVTPSTTFVNNSTAPQPYGASFTVTASSNETGVVSQPTITSSTPTICTITGSSSSGASTTATVQMQSGQGSCDLAAAYAINSVYKAASASLHVAASKVAPSVSLTGAPASAADHSSFTVTATSNETGSATAVPTIKGTPASTCTVGTVTSIGGGSYQATVTMTKATGTCTTTAKWAATTDYDLASATETTAATN